MQDPRSTYDLGDGYSLDYYGHGSFRFSKDGHIVGSLSMSRGFEPTSSDSEFSGRLASVQDVMVYPDFALSPQDRERGMASARGKGLYRRALPILKRLYGGVRSDHRGATSDDASKAWNKVGARRVLTTDDPARYGGSWYALESLVSQLLD